MTLNPISVRSSDRETRLNRVLSDATLALWRDDRGAGIGVRSVFAAKTCRWFSWWEAGVGSLGGAIAMGMSSRSLVISVDGVGGEQRLSGITAIRCGSLASS